MVMLPLPNRKWILFFLALLLLLGSCTQPTPTRTPVISPTITPTTDWYSVYFTDPTGPSAEYFEGGPDVALANAIDQARLSVDVAIYDLDLSSVRAALLRAHQRGVTVRMVVESTNLDETEIQALKDAGIPILGDRREGYMHNKFAVIDRLEVWTGSMNYTANDAYRNDNDLIRIRSSKLAEDYTTEFNEMFVNDLFGPDYRAATPYTNLVINGTSLEIYFSPDDHVAKRIVELIKGADESVYFMAFSFTSNSIASAMLERFRAGVTVAGVFEESQVISNVGTEYENLLNAGAAVRLDGNPRNMHNKIIIIDQKTVITGSYNFSSNAEYDNDENVVIIHNADIAALYMQEFQKVYERAKE